MISIVTAFGNTQVQDSLRAELKYIANVNVCFPVGDCKTQQELLSVLKADLQQQVVVLYGDIPGTQTEKEFVKDVASSTNSKILLSKAIFSCCIQ